MGRNTRQNQMARAPAAEAALERFSTPLKTRKPDLNIVANVGLVVPLLEAGIRVKTVEQQQLTDHLLAKLPVLAAAVVVLITRVQVVGRALAVVAVRASITPVQSLVLMAQSAETAAKATQAEAEEAEA